MKYTKKYLASRNTPARPHERVRGSKRNAPGSAQSPRGRIVLSPSTVAALKAKAKAHNARPHQHPARLGALKAVYRRGSGAFSTSHAPGKTRAQWAMARVNAFLHLLRTGKPRNKNYTQDNDLF